MLSKKIQEGSRITDDGLAQEILTANGLENGLPKKHIELFRKSEISVAQPMCPRIRSHIDLAQCGAPEKISRKWLQLKETTPLECRRPCTAAPDKIDGPTFVSRERQLALFASPKLEKPLNELFQKEWAIGIGPIGMGNNNTGLDASDLKIIVSANDPLDNFAHTLSALVKSMDQIGVDKK